jgi:hypothetical protein
MRRMWICLLVGLAGCQNQTKEIDGRPVIGVRWVDGKVVYILGQKAGDKEATERMAKEATDAAAGVVFEGKKP